MARHRRWLAGDYGNRQGLDWPRLRASVGRSFSHLLDLGARYRVTPESQEAFEAIDAGAAMAHEPIDYVKFADECERLARKQPGRRDRRALLRLAEAWLLMAELAHLHEEDRPSKPDQTKPTAGATRSGGFRDPRAG